MIRPYPLRCVLVAMCHLTVLLFFVFNSTEVIGLVHEGRSLLLLEVRK